MMTTEPPIRKRSQTSARPLRVLVTAGPTYEPIDAVRFLGNRSSGAMGIAIADAFAASGARCTLLLGPTHRLPAHSRVKVVRFRTTHDLQRLLAQHFPVCDILIMAAAVADFRPPLTKSQPRGKLPRTAAGLTLRLEPTPDLVAQVCARRRGGQMVVGFALEPRKGMEAAAMGKLSRKGLDLIVANPLETMESVSIHGRVLDGQGVIDAPGRALSKPAFARRLVRTIVGYRGATLD